MGDIKEKFKKRKMNWKKRWKKIRRGIKYPILVFFIKVFILIFRMFSRKFVLKVCSGLGKLAFILVKQERKKTIQNLTLIYGDEKSTDEIYKMAQQVFVHQALNFGDYVHTLHYTTREQFSQIVEIKGEEHLKAAYEAGKGVLSLMSHTAPGSFQPYYLLLWGIKPLPSPDPCPIQRLMI
ncbi:lipid A biosynthesis lauroyl acyltransferase [Geofilum rubicundum JCM 15548]|uniref:Lipid A biosynthesis lauroyl acyltransferase n=1 Tax=Geofilum rubicundum JCM 15548 TaxID=1236989 RepID=A0A0E9M1J4_9BACT|nr:lipid A biosynthesis lauroyl acyltransferase [Geofilum rubicundum JCM 15548]